MASSRKLYQKFNYLKFGLKGSFYWTKKEGFAGYKKSSLLFMARWSLQRDIFEDDVMRLFGVFSE